MKEPHCKVCNDNLAPGGRCSSCGASRATLEESARTLAAAQPRPFEQFAGKFSGNIDELTAMLDIYGYMMSANGTRSKTNLAQIVRDIEEGELPTSVRARIWVRYTY